LVRGFWGISKIWSGGFGVEMGQGVSFPKFGQGVLGYF